MPINDVFVRQFRDRSKIRLFYGGYGSGKSVFIAQDLISKAITDPYFKCYYGRKYYANVHNSCFETLYETIEEMGYAHLFQYSKADNSTMKIRCVLNGNTFIPFGCDKADKLKSIKDPTHIWCEEFDQFEDGAGEKQGDFQILYPRLRTVKAKTEFIASFNTAPVYENHWILRYFFPELYKGDDKPGDWFNEVLAGMDIVKTFGNYVHNHFINREEYYNQLKFASNGNTLLLQAIAEGAWGVSANDNPWLYAFDRATMVRDVAFLPAFPVYISFDFNNAPFAATAWQYSGDMGNPNAFVHCIKEFTGDFKIEDMCKRISTAFPASILYVTGDRSGQNQDIGRNQTLYQMIQALLNVNSRQMNLNTHNLEHSDSRALMNALFAHYPHLSVHPSCTNFIRQCEIAKVDIKSMTPHKLLKDRGMYKMDEFDSGRYFFQTYFLEYAKKKYFRFF